MVVGLLVEGACENFVEEMQHRLRFWMIVWLSWWLTVTGASSVGRDDCWWSESGNRWRSKDGSSWCSWLQSSQLADWCRHVSCRLSAVSLWSLLSYRHHHLLVILLTVILPSSGQHLSNDDCPEDKRENYQNCSVLCCVRQLYIMIRTHTREQFFNSSVGLGLVFCAFV